jgi:hypothetical protein
MDKTVAERLADVHPKMLAARDEGDRKPLAERDWRRLVGQTIERALTLAHLTKQEVSYAMGYSDQSAVSRWIAGVERPLFDKLFAVDRFYDAWVIAAAEANPRADVQTVVTIRRTA